MSVRRGARIFQRRRCDERDGQRSIRRSIQGVRCRPRGFAQRGAPPVTQCTTRDACHGHGRGASADQCSDIGSLAMSVLSCVDRGHISLCSAAGEPDEGRYRTGRNRFDGTARERAGFTCHVRTRLICLHACHSVARATNQPCVVAANFFDFFSSQKLCGNFVP